MALSRIFEGKSNSIAAGVPNEAVTQPVAHAPMFARPGEPEPNVHRGERLQPATPRPRRAPTRTRDEARAIGLAHAEALDLSREEVLAYEV